VSPAILDQVGQIFSGPPGLQAKIGIYRRSENLRPAAAQWV